MRNRIIGGLAVLALAVPGTVALTAISAEASTGVYYSSCDKLDNKFPHGVAKSRLAANRQVREGYSRPAFGPLAQRVYAENKARLDRDKDGTACER